MRQSHGVLPRWILLPAAALTALLLVGTTATGCGDAGRENEGTGGDNGVAGAALQVVADTGFIADIAQNVAGERMTVETLIPPEADPHSFEPTPRDARSIAESRAVIINSYGLSPAVDDLIASAGDKGLLVIEAATGLPGRSPQGEEVASDEEGIDPHFWLDPNKVIQYVENVRAGLTVVDPEGAETYRQNAETYTLKLRELDSWIKEQVDTIPAERRLLVTNHETFGYFADRYGFKIVGSIFASTGGEGTPSAQQLATLVEEIKATGTPAILLEAGSNPELADLLARETGVKVVTDLRTHSLGNDAPTYLDMMRWNVERIVEALR